MDVHFINSSVGRKFLDYTMPELVRQITKLNNHLEKLIVLENELVKPVGDINKEIKEDIKNIVNIRKSCEDWKN